MKTFCIGFSKTATRSLHATAAAHGCRALHHPCWWRTTRLEAFESYVRQHGTLPPQDHPNMQWHPEKPAFYGWQDYDFFSDSNRPRFDLLDQLFPDSYFILNTRSLYHWLTSMYNHLMRNRSGAPDAGHWRTEPSVEYLSRKIREREAYYQEVFAYFDGRTRFTVVNIEADDEARVRGVLQAAIGRPVERLCRANMHKDSSGYEPNPAPVEAALKACNIPPARWHRTLL